MWTCESFLQYSKGHRKNFKEINKNGSKPKKLFKPISKIYKNNLEDYFFQYHNWNDTDLLRDYIQNNLIDKDLNILKYNDLTIYYCFDNDIRRATIIHDKKYIHDTYEIGWYKNRGTTSYITKNNSVIHLNEYVELLNLLYS